MIDINRSSHWSPSTGNILIERKTLFICPVLQQTVTLHTDIYPTFYNFSPYRTHIL